MTTLHKTKTNEHGYEHIAYRHSLTKQTSTDDDDDMRDLTRPSLSRDANILKKNTAAQPTQTIVNDNITVQQNSVPATVLRDEDISVLCEVELQAGHIHINLPKSLFPEGIHYGTPITIRFEKDQYGIRKPSVSLRQLDTESDELRQENDEMRLLFDNF